MLLYFYIISCDEKKKRNVSIISNPILQTNDEIERRDDTVLTSNNNSLKDSHQANIESKPIKREKKTAPKKVSSKEKVVSKKVDSKSEKTKSIPKAPLNKEQKELKILKLKEELSNLVDSADLDSLKKRFDKLLEGGKQYLLDIAIEKERYEVVEAFINHTKKANFTIGKSGKHLLEYLLERDKLELVKLALRVDSSISVETKEKLIEIALRRGKKEIVSILLDLLSKSDYKLEDSYVRLVSQMTERPLFTALAIKGYNDLIKFTLENFEVAKEDKQDAFIEAYNRDNNEIMELLIKEGFNGDNLIGIKKNGQYTSANIISALRYKDRLDLLELVFDNQIDIAPHVKAEGLYNAYLARKYDFVEFLIKKGVSINSFSDHSLSLESLVLRNNKLNESLKFILENRKVSMRQKNRALRRALIIGADEISKMLIKNGARMTQTIKPNYNDYKELLVPIGFEAKLKMDYGDIQYSYKNILEFLLINGKIDLLLMVLENLSEFAIEKRELRQYIDYAIQQNNLISALIVTLQLHSQEDLIKASDNIEEYISNGDLIDALIYLINLNDEFVDRPEELTLEALHKEVDNYKDIIQHIVDTDKFPENINLLLKRSIEN